MKRKTLKSIVAVILCGCLLSAAAFPAFSDSNVLDLFSSLLNGGSVNITELFSEWLESEVSGDEKDKLIDDFVDNLKDKFMGSDEPEPDVTGPNDQDDSVTLTEGEKSNIAELFNLSVNELKNGSPAFTKIETASLDQKAAESLGGGLGAVTGIVESLIGDKDIFAGVIDGSTGGTNEVRERYPSGNDVVNNLPIKGRNYVANLTGDEISDYSVTIYKSGAYRMHVDFNDVQGSAAASGLSHVFDTSDKGYATINLGQNSININVMLKYVDNYAECEVNRNGMITNYLTSMGITFLFQQDDGSWSSKMPFLGVDFEERDIVYRITTEYSGIDYSLRQPGDVNNDGKINSTDARMALRASAGLDELSEDDSPYLDVNLDRKISATDAREILRASARISVLPTATEALGLKEYVKPQSVSDHVDDLLILIMAYQEAKDEKEQQELQDSYNDKYNNQNNAAQEETTTGKLLTEGDKVGDLVGDIGGFIGDLFNE